MTRSLYENEVERHLLALREALVRHDENEAAYTLMTSCVPYYLRTRSKVVIARLHQEKMTKHLRDPAIYDEYYGSNPHELPFEQMFGISVDEISERMPRVKWLIDRLRDMGAKRVLDLACNDGAIARHIMDSLPDLAVEGRDLNPGCVTRARERGVVASVEDEALAGPIYDAVYAMEVIEHVPDPVRFLQHLAERAPVVFISTPLGATEMGEVERWNKVEYKGHVRAILPEDLSRWAKEANLSPEWIGIAAPSTILMEARIIGSDGSTN